MIRLNFSTDDLLLFSAASHDRHPLHMSEAYARSTRYGAPIVFGVLAGLAGLRHLAPRPAAALTRASFTFRSALHLDTDYLVTIDEDHPDRAEFTIHDGDQEALVATLTFEGREAAAPLEVKSVDGEPARIEARVWPPADLTEGLVLEGRYAPNPERARALVERLDLSPRGIADGELAVLLGCSYLVGMELPGRRATFASMSIEWERPSGPLPVDYRLELRRRDRRFEQLTLGVDFGPPAAPSARATLQTFVRED